MLPISCGSRAGVDDDVGCGREDWEEVVLVRRLRAIVDDTQLDPGSDECMRRRSERIGGGRLVYVISEAWART